jgi:hypothetical protein
LIDRALGLSIDSGGMHLYGSAYFVGLPLPDGDHHLDVCRKPDLWFHLT